MASHSEIALWLGVNSKTFSDATAGVTTVTAGNSTFTPKELRELIRVADNYGFEVVVTAGAFKIRPKDSTL